MPIYLKPTREKSLLRRHPWIFSGAVQKVTDPPATLGETVEIFAADGTWLARGAYSPHSQIVARVWTFAAEETDIRAVIQRRLHTALAARAGLPNENAMRLVYAESDGLPGVVVDQYADYVVCQFLSAGAEFWKRTIVEHLLALHPCAGVYERSDVDVRTKEGLTPLTGVLAGQAPPALIEIKEDEVRFVVDVVHGHKTGFYLDQSLNRQLLAQYAAGCEVLNCFAYTGGFGVWALQGGAARLTNVDTSASALELAQQNVALNPVDASRVENTEGDVFRLLRTYRDARRQFDLIVLDPPKFAESQAQVEGASRGYKDINLLALKLLRPGGVLFTFSCSGAISPDLFQKIVAGAALDSGRAVQIIHRLSQSPDHPVALNFPEGEYLKGLVCRVSSE